MKFSKYVLAVALALGASANISQAQTVRYLATGSSALFLELGQSAASLPTTGCYWTHPAEIPTFRNTVNIWARDDRPTIPAGQTDEYGDIWIAWGPGSGTCAAPVAPFDIYSEMSLDSVVGERCFFMVNAADVGGCIQFITIAPGTLGAGLLGAGFDSDTSLGIPSNVISALNGSRMNAAPTDIRPEDAKFASLRMLTSCGARIARNPYEATSFYSTGLGYQSGTPGIGYPISSGTSVGSQFNVYDFNISGTDPLSGQPLSGAGRTSYVLTTVGVKPIMVTVGPVTSTGIGAATDIPFSTLAEFLTGVYGRATDLIGPTAPNAVVALLLEPLSGAYNAMEFSITGSNEFKTTQELSNCSSLNPGAVKASDLYLNSANSKVTGAERIRALGTAEEVAALINPSICTTSSSKRDCIGYWFWSAGNAAKFTAANQKYLTVNGVDPILTRYTANPNGPGVIPNAGNGGLSSVTFANLNAGDYPIWSALRIVSTPAVVPAVNALVSEAEILNATQNNFIPLANLKVWKSHFDLPALGITNNSNGMTVNPATPGDLCSLAASAPEGGGDVGAITISITGNNDFCTDFDVPIGITDKNQ